MGFLTRFNLVEHVEQEYTSDGQYPNEIVIQTSFGSLGSTGGER